MQPFDSLTPSLVDSQGVPLFDVFGWLAAAFVFAAAWVAGAAAAPMVSFRSRLDGALARMALGLGVLAAAVLVAGQIPRLIFYPYIWIVAVAAAAYAFRKRIVGGFGEGPITGENVRAAQVGSEEDSPGARVGRILCIVGWILVAATLLVLLGPALSPSLNYDALEYHVGVIPHYYARGTIAPIPGVFYSAQPLGTEMLYALGAAIERLPRGNAPGLVQWGLIAFAALLLARALRAFAAPRSLAPWLVLLFLAHPTIFKLELDRLTDLTGAIFMLAGLLVAASTPEKEEKDSRRWLLLGLLAGGALGAKWTNAGTSCAALFFLAMAFAPRRRSAALAFFCGAAAIFAPWAIWLWIRAGNPFAPFMAARFEAAQWGAQDLKYLLASHRPLSPLGAEYWRNLSARLSGLHPFVELAAISLFSLAAAIGFRRAGARGGKSRALPAAFALFASIALACLTWGRLGDAAERFLAPVAVAQVALAGILLGEIAPRIRRREPILAGAIAILALMHLWRGPALLLRAKEPPYWACATGRVSPEEFLASGLGATARLFAGANALPPGSRVLALNEARGFYLRGDVALASPFDASPIREAAASAGHPDTIGLRLAELGYTHLLVNEWEAARILTFQTPPALANDPAFRAAVDAARADRAAMGALAERYAGYAEFAARPLDPSNMQTYRAFLARLRARHARRGGAPAPYPSFWIAPIEAGGK